MARIDDLIASVADEELRSEMAEALAELTQHRSYGLVFERHVPESVMLRGPIRVGDLVAPEESPAEEGRVLKVSSRQVQVDVRGEIRKFAPSKLLLVRRFGEAIYPALRHTGNVTRGGDRPHHIAIEAENYHALQLLTYTHHARVDCIYLDPPYNTEDKTWKYNNSYVDKVDRYRHSKWLSMMERRLLLCKELLRPDGVLIVTIDEHEIHRLGVLLDQVFPDYLCQTVSIVNNPKGTGKKNFARTNEFAIFCIPFKGEEQVIGGLVTAPTSRAVVDEEEDDDQLFEAAPELEDEEYSEANGWELRHARRRGSQSSYREQRKGQFYPIYIDPEAREVHSVGSAPPLDEPPNYSAPPGLVAIWPIDDDNNERCWRFVPTTMQELIDHHRVVVGRRNKKRDTWTLNIWERSNQRKRPKSVWWDSRHDAGTHGTVMLHDLLGRRDAFPFPKSVYAVEDCLAAVVRDRPDAVIVDVFAGSGTTAHATMLLNAEDGGRRTSILVSNNELGPSDEKRLRAAGQQPGSVRWEASGIFRSVTRPRIEAVVKGRSASGEALTGRHVGGRPYAEGFEENVDFFELGLLDPYSVEIGRHFSDVYPLLWMSAGHHGALESPSGDKPWVIAGDQRLGVLLDDLQLTGFSAAVEADPRITSTWIVTDSESRFEAAQRELSVPVSMLYRSYLESFVLNTRIR